MESNRIHKFLFSTGVLFVVLCLFAPMAMATDQIDLRQAADVLKKLQNSRSEDLGVALHQALGLDQNTTLELIQKQTDSLNFTHYRYEIRYQGISVWGRSLIVTQSAESRVHVMYGDAVLGIERDIAFVEPQFDANSALQKMKEHHRASTKSDNWLYAFENSELAIYPEGERAVLCYVVSFFADVENGGRPTNPLYIVDAQTGNILAEHEYLMTDRATATGPGGNAKTGQYFFGSTYPEFEVTSSNGKSIMDVAGKVMTVNLNHGSSGSTPYSFEGTDNTYKAINGAYCPLNDAQAFGMAVYQMYQAWYQMAPLSSQLVLKVHYSTNYENAFYNSYGGFMAFGDGKDRFYPLVSLDVVSHEVAHGVTRRFSNLNYSAQSGGINESFSDMAGEAAEFFLTGKNDFMVGATIFKVEGKALRYMQDPPLDGKSIGHVDQYTSGMDVHYSSGVYNKVFYLLATSEGWDTQMAFDVFVRCNTSKWTASTNFAAAGPAVRDAAAELGYNTNDVVTALGKVGVNITD